MAQINKPNVIMKPSDMYKNATGQALDAYKQMSDVMNMKKQTELQSKEFEWNKRLKAAESFYNGLLVPLANQIPGGMQGLVRNMGPQMAPFMELLGFSKQATQAIFSKMATLPPGQEEVMQTMMANYLANSIGGERSGLPAAEAEIKARKGLMTDLIKVDGGAAGALGEARPETQGSPGQEKSQTSQGGDVSYQPGVDTTAGTGRPMQVEQYGEPTENMYASQSKFDESKNKMVRMPDKNISSGGEYTLSEQETLDGASGSLAYWIRSGITGNPREDGAPQTQEDILLQNNIRAEIDKLNEGNKSRTLKLPDWANQEKKAEPMPEPKVESQPAAESSKRKMTGIVGNLKRAGTVGNTPVGEATFKKNLDAGLKEFKVYWSNSVVTPEIIKNAVTHFSDADLKDYLLGIPGQTQKLLANENLQLTLQENSQMLQADMFNAEMLNNVTQFGIKMGLEEEKFTHLKNMDWKNMDLNERQVALSELMATEAHILMKAKATLRAQAEAAGPEGVGMKEFLGYFDSFDAYIKDPDLLKDMPAGMRPMFNNYVKTLANIMGMEAYESVILKFNGKFQKEGGVEFDAPGRGVTTEKRSVTAPVGHIDIEQIRSGAQTGGQKQAAPTTTQSLEDKILSDLTGGR